MRSNTPPPFAEAPFNFGWERRVIRFEPTQREPTQRERAPPPDAESAREFPTFNDQLRKGKGGNFNRREAAPPAASTAAWRTEATNKRQRVATPQKPRHVPSEAAPSWANESFDGMDVLQMSQMMQQLQMQMRMLEQAMQVQQQAASDRVAADMEDSKLFEDDGQDY